MFHYLFLATISILAFGLFGENEGLQCYIQSGLESSITAGDQGVIQNCSASQPYCVKMRCNYGLVPEIHKSCYETDRRGLHAELAACKKGRIRADVCKALKLQARHCNATFCATDLCNNTPVPATTAAPPSATTAATASSAGALFGIGSALVTALHALLFLMLQYCARPHLTYL